MSERWEVRLSKHRRIIVEIGEELTDEEFRERFSAAARGFEHPGLGRFQEPRESMLRAADPDLDAACAAVAAELEARRPGAVRSKPGETIYDFSGAPELRARWETALDAAERRAAERDPLPVKPGDLVEVGGRVLRVGAVDARKRTCTTERVDERGEVVSSVPGCRTDLLAPLPPGTSPTGGDWPAFPAHLTDGAERARFVVRVHDAHVRAAGLLDRPGAPCPRPPLRAEGVPADLHDEHVRVQGALVSLARACMHFSEAMGWDGDPYSTVHDERPWKAAREAAQAAITRETGAPAKGPREGTTPLRAAIARLVGADVAGAAHEADLRLLREAVSRLDGLREGREVWTTCPTCGTGGLHLTRAALHLLGCVAQPSVAEARVALEQAKAALGDDAPAPPAGVVVAPLRPLEPGEVFYRHCFDELCRDLARSPGATAWQAHQLWSLADELEAIDAAAAWRCPGCDAPVPLVEAAAHLASCAGHPARRYAALVAARLPEAAARHRQAIADAVRRRDACDLELGRLLSACDALWSASRDGDRGKSLFRRDACRAFDGAWQRAFAVAEGRDVGSGEEGGRDEGS